MVREHAREDDVIDAVFLPPKLHLRRTLIPAPALNLVDGSQRCACMSA
jgi:hypothetical protein